MNTNNLQVILTKDILISPDRQRKEFDLTALQELGNSIQGKGLLHAVVLRQTEAGMVLVAGERRLKAVIELQMLGGRFKFNNQVIPEDYIPYVNIGDLSALEAEECELEENLHRKDLTWQESSAAMAKLHKIRSGQAQAQGRVHTVADTAMETKGRSDGSYQEAVRREILIAKHLDNPLIAKAKDTNEAFKILKKQEEVQKNVALALVVGKTFSSEVHRALNVNCLDWMRSAIPEQFDVILTDPPYGMGAQAFGDGGDGKMANSEHHYDDSYESWKELMTAWAPLSYAVAKPEAHAYVFCDLDNFHELKLLMQLAGWYVFRTPFICTKPNSGRVPLPDRGPRRQYETLLYAIKGKKKTTAIYPDVITTVQDLATTHGAQKPVELYKNLLLRSIRPGDHVLDCFAGSGTIFPACHQMKCKATGLEQNPEYFAMMWTRLQDLDKETPVDGMALMNELKGMLG
jgi:DNA modification methylase